MQKTFLYLTFIILTLFVTAKQAIALHSDGVGTIITSSDGKKWTIDVGWNADNGSPKYNPGDSFTFNFTAYWCTRKTAKACASNNDDYRGVKKATSFTVTLPQQGQVTQVDFDFDNLKSDYPCGRVQADAEHGGAIEGEIYGKNGTDCNATASLKQKTNACHLEATWDVGYNDDPSCNTYIEAAGTDYPITENCKGSWDSSKDTVPSGLSIHNGGIYKLVTGDISAGPVTLNCPPPPPSAPTNLFASCPAPGTSATLSWTASTGATAHNLRVNQFTGATPEWNDNCTSPQSGDFCTDDATSPKSFLSTAGATYSWWVDACNSGGCTTGSGRNFPCVTIPTLAVQCSVSPTSATTGTNVTWTAQVSGGSSPYTYSWSGTDSLQDKTSNPAVVSYTTAGTKTGSVKVTDSAGVISPLTACTNSVTITAPDLIVNSLSPVSSNVGNSVTFSGKVVNQGNGSAGASSTRLRYDSDRDGTLDTTLTNQSTGTLAAGGSETETWPAVIFSTAGSYAFEICADIGGAVAESSDTNNCTPDILTVSPAGTPAAPTVTTTLTCIDAGYSGSGFTITYGSRTPAVTWANISSSSTFSSYYHKDVTGTTSTTAPNGFNLNPSSPPQPLSLNPATTYYVRVSDGTQNSGVSSFSIPACAAASPSPSPSPSPAISPSPSPGTSPSPSSCPWIQTTGGDVHSNTGINTPCGP